MIKLEHVVLPSPEQMEFVIEGMRNPKNSWDRIDSFICKESYEDCNGNCPYFSATDSTRCPIDDDEDHFIIGDADLKLMVDLSDGGPVHRKYMRMMPVMVRVTAPLYWWKEFDTYKVGTVANSCSTMHKIHAKEFTMDDFSCEHLIDSDLIDEAECEAYEEAGKRKEFDDKYCAMLAPVDMFETIYPADYSKFTVSMLNRARELYLKTKDKRYWWQMIQLLPSSYNQTRNVMLNYEVLANIYKWRHNHKLDEWVTFCKWIETLPYSEIITGSKEE